ncbi:DUF4260 domain-containing protein [Demequina sp. NBRC 110055]|uniref:DUF4260 domain-containing protein n=1 Tax=Demequina sp. NBRC 110055 TaxID=1570344 RepID=UPI000A03ACCB|nr:DUF4260 domain-containing protein [Demequina sp. NBRC 110055]
MSTAMWQRVESIAIAAGIVLVTVMGFGYAWWWLLALFLVFDLSALGYLAGPRVCAVLYNAGHSYIGPVLAAGLFALSGADAVMIAALAWAFHVAADRALGYGLKENDDFQHTHLGWIGKREAH